MNPSDESTILTCGGIVIATVTLRDLLPPERGGSAQGFVPKHLLGGMAATTLLLVAGMGAPELAKGFAIIMATVSFLYSGANVMESFFTDVDVSKRPNRPIPDNASRTIER